MKRTLIISATLGFGLCLPSCGSASAPASSLSDSSSGSNGQPSTPSAALFANCGSSAQIPNPYPKIPLSSQSGGNIHCIGNFSTGVNFFVQNIAAPVTGIFGPTVLTGNTSDAIATAPVLPAGVYDLLITD